MNARTNKRKSLPSKDLPLVQSVRAITDGLKFSDPKEVLANFVEAFVGGSNGVGAWWYMAIEDPKMNDDLPTISRKVLMFEGDEGMRCERLKGSNVPTSN